MVSSSCFTLRRAAASQRRLSLLRSHIMHIAVLCRDEAQKLWKEHEALEAAGLRVVCVVHEWIDREVSMRQLH